MTHRRTTPILLLVLLAGLGATGAAQDADATRYAVTYVEVMPSAAARAIDAFKRYREASTKESGFAKAELFASRGRSAGDWQPSG
jgi:hypothetical protein